MNVTLTWTQQVLASTTDEIRLIGRAGPSSSAGRLVLSPSARLVEEYIRDIPEGESRDIATVRRDLAARCGADATSLPALRERLLAIAEAVFDELDDGALLREVAPVWRVRVEDSDVLLSRLSFEPAFLFDLRDSERVHSVEIDRQAA
jgi:hypothetical protein